MTVKMLVANWKMNPENSTAAERLFSAVLGARPGKNLTIAVCPPFVYLENLSRLLKKNQSKNKIKLGAQDVFWQNAGAYTGEISPPMLKNFGAEYVILGHSERRFWLGETDTMVTKKLSAVMREGLQPVLCVGEPLLARKKGPAAARRFVANQLVLDLKNIGGKRNFKNLPIIAYEPIWAIGTGKSDKPEEAVAMARFIRNFTASRLRLPGVAVLYGGSVDSGNLINFLQYKEIDGALVGGASIDSREFKKMINIVR